MKAQLLNIQKVVFVSLLALLFTNCTSDETMVPDVESKIAFKTNKELFTSTNAARKSGKGTEYSDHFNITKITRTGDILHIEVNYSGGCKEHTFEALWTGEVLFSDPCQINLLLTHDANNDTCELQITETLEIDLNKLIRNNHKDICTIKVFSVLNQSEEADGNIIN